MELCVGEGNEVGFHVSNQVSVDCAKPSRCENSPESGEVNLWNGRKKRRRQM